MTVFPRLDDGTPFFYLGDTHWTMPKEEFDSAGPNAGDIETNSHFRYIVDRRAAQGFTVYQSEPLYGQINVSDGDITLMDIAAFQNLDRYFKYIDEKGKFDLNKANPLVYSHGEYYSLGKKLGTFGYSVKKKKTKKR